MKQIFGVLFLCFSIIANAQGIQHVVKAGENLSSIANQYKVSVANILAANAINANALLKVGQKLVIPTNATKPVVAAPKPTVTTNAKQHVVMAGETLGKIARQHGVTEKDLKNWNNLQTDLIKIGQVISLVNNGNVVKPITPKPIVPKPEVVEKVEPMSKDVVPTTNPATPVTKPVIEEGKPVNEPIAKKSEETKPTVVEEKTIPTPAAPATIITSTNSANVGNSFFEQEFKASGASQTLNCKSFKTSAGWQDKKYYALTNLVEAGTIIKITANNKTTYAKVLGVLPETNNNTEVPIRISSATAQQLGLDFTGINSVLVEY